LVPLGRRPGSNVAFHLFSLLPERRRLGSIIAICIRLVLLGSGRSAGRLGLFVGFSRERQVHCAAGPMGGMGKRLEDFNRNIGSMQADHP
jgi:hypothetical protein